MIIFKHEVVVFVIGTNNGYGLRMCNLDTILTCAYVLFAFIVVY